MVSLMLWLVLGVVSAPGSEPVTKSDAEFRHALQRGGYRWYDGKSDAARPLWPPKPPTPRNPSGLSWLRALGLHDLGELLMTGLILLALAVLLALLVELWRRYEPTVAEARQQPATVGSAVSIESLPAGVRPETDDPWSEALRCREKGDYAGAVISLFAHQLLALHQRQVLRLRPGRTGRQLVRSIDDRRFLRSVEPTLRLFEAVYYGHLSPSREAFEAVWTLAEDFERHMVAGTGS